MDSAERYSNNVNVFCTVIAVDETETNSVGQKIKINLKIIFFNCITIHVYVYIYKPFLKNL